MDKQQSYNPEIVKCPCCHKDNSFFIRENMHGFENIPTLGRVELSPINATFHICCECASCRAEYNIQVHEFACAYNVLLSLGFHRTAKWMGEWFDEALEAKNGKA